MSDNEKLVKIYIKIRDARAAAKREFEAEDKRLKEQQERVGAELLRFLNDNKLENANTAHGVFYKTEDVTPSAADWDTIYKWIVKNNAFDALEKRLKKTFISQYMEENKGEAPPGVNVMKQYVIRVRRDA